MNRYSRSTGAILDSTDRQPIGSTSERDPLDLRAVQTVPETGAGELQHSSSVVRERGDRESMNHSDTAKRAGVAAECGLCLCEFQDSGEKVPRNLVCGHTFCTG